MNKEKCIEQLKDLKKHCEYQHQNSDEIWGEDVKALEYAIRILSETVQEVPVREKTESIMEKLLSQERIVKEKIDIGEMKEGTLEYTNGLLGIDLSEKQFSALAISDFTTKEYRVVEILKVLKILNII
ncbi:hypothetical protein ACFO6R_14770 [Eubacterium multiforme]|uniref:Uncharacterized protein n=1 Tax=Eubacterium multiforme TaxID=83339 RepID=A0ABT9UWK0_9FIRM|nr:hypothetical protein [Eubacterium multiforme]MDQ0150707.1 hypothetical protein [Eubacterium multiforme]